MLTTHDLPTVTGVWTGADEAELVELGRPTPPEEVAAVRDRLDRLVDLEPGSPVEDVVAVAHRALSEGASALVLGTLEDLCGVSRRPNLPGTTSEERLSWSTALPLAVDDLPSDEGAKRTIRALAEPRSPGATG